MCKFLHSEGVQVIFSESGTFLYLGRGSPLPFPLPIYFFIYLNLGLTSTAKEQSCTTLFEKLLHKVSSNVTLDF